jgi:AraC family transcriptional regulator
MERIVSLQSRFAEAIDRCPGRTYGQRRQVFARLQRVRNYLLANCTLEIGNRELAHLANYSPTHFIRAFQCVYGETPHKFLVKQRLRRAAELVRHSSLAINEVAIVSGFESPSAFSRLFRRRFGMTAGTMRRLGSQRRLHVGQGSEKKPVPSGGVKIADSAALVL